MSSTGSGATTSSTGGESAAAAAVMSGALTEEQRKAINRRQNILRELVTTERSYVVALRTCLETYLEGTRNPPVDIQVRPSLFKFYFGQI